MRHVLGIIPKLAPAEAVATMDGDATALIPKEVGEDLGREAVRACIGAYVAVDRYRQFGRTDPTLRQFFPASLPLHEEEFTRLIYEFIGREVISKDDAESLINS